MNPALIAVLVQYVFTPLIAGIIRAHYNATGKLPTDAEVIAALAIDTQTYIDFDRAWLAAHPPGTP